MANLNRYSSRITQPRSQGASQAMLLGTGLQPADLDKPQIGIVSMWYEGNTCNMHLDKLAAKVREGVLAAGMVGMRFNTIGVSDGISMGTDGMSYSLPSRDIIADSIETVMQAQWYDALVAIPGCDKNMPGSLIAMGRLNRPSLMVYGGTIKPGHLVDGETFDTRVPVPVPAAACTPPTRWPRPSRPWVCRYPTAHRFQRKTQPNKPNASGLGQPFAICLNWTSSPATL